MNGLRATPFAKINLGLRVLGRRPDGYHELSTVFQTISLADRMLFEPAHDLSLEVGGHWPVPADSDNLVLKAARLLAERFPGKGARITLEKEIPPGAGLGGGSSDAAVTLLALCVLWGIDHDPLTLDTLARQLGADVPFFLHGGTCMGVGRGDEILPLADARPWPLVVVWPGSGLSTREVFGALPESLTMKRILSSMRGFVASPVAETESVEPPDLTNDLETTAFRQLPLLEKQRERLMNAGAIAVAMSGSGSAVFGLFSGEARLERIAASLSSAGAVAFACHMVPGERYRSQMFERL